MRERMPQKSAMKPDIPAKTFFLIVAFLRMTENMRHSKSKCQALLWKPTWIICPYSSVVSQFCLCLKSPIILRSIFVFLRCVKGSKHRDKMISETHLQTS